MPSPAKWPRPLRWILFLLLAALFVLQFLWWVAVPDAGVFARAVEAAVARSGDFRVTINDPSKSLFFGLNIGAISVSGNGIQLVPAREIRLRARPAALLAGRLALRVRADVFGGRLVGDISVSKRGPGIKFRLDRAGISELISLSGMEGKGFAGMEGNIVAGTGAVKIQITEISLTPSGFAAVLPVDLFRSVNGMLELVQGTINVKGVEIEGEGIHARLSGTATQAALNLDLELFPDAETAEKNSFLLAGIGRYRKSPGHYSIPIRGTLARPVIR